MPWWGGGDNNNNSHNNDNDTMSKDFSSDLEDGGVFASSGGFAGSGGGGTGVAEMQQLSVALQQQMIVQQVINDLSDRAYTQCVTSKPSDTLSGTQVACIKSTVNKWFDTNEFMTGRLARKAQKQQQASSFS